MDELPMPLVPPDADCRQFDGFMLNVERLLASELWALSTGDEFKAAHALWCRAWKQIPAGSLPDDERVLAQFSYAGRNWRRVREMALHGFVRCSDGRLYHPVLCEDVLRAIARHKHYLDRRERDAKRLSDWRSKHERNADETHGETRFETPLKRVRQEQDVTGRIDSDAYASVAEATSADPDVVATANATNQIFDLGVELLGAGSRSLVGKARKQHGDLVTMEALLACRAEGASEPVEFFIGCLKQRGNANGADKRSPVEKLYAGAFAAAEEWERREGNRGDSLTPALPLLDGGRSAGGAPSSD